MRPPSSQSLSIKDTAHGGSPWTMEIHLRHSKRGLLRIFSFLFSLTLPLPQTALHSLTTVGQREIHIRRDSTDRLPARGSNRPRVILSSRTAISFTPFPCPPKQRKGTAAQDCAEGTRRSFRLALCGSSSSSSTSTSMYNSLAVHWL